MSPTSRTLPKRAPSKAKPKRKKKNKPGWLAWLPLVLGVLVTPVARRAADVLAMEGPGALNLLYPYVAVLKMHALGLPEELGSNLSQLMIYLQFPLYGTIASLVLRSQGWVRALLATLAVHGAAVLLLFTLAHM